MNQRAGQIDLELSPAPRGFTLVELLIVVALVGIIAAVAVPSFAGWYDRARVDAHTDRLVSAVAVARSAAMKFGTPVVLCASANGTSCGGGWPDGWLVFRDDDGDGDVSGSDPLLLNERGDAAATIALSTSGGAAVAALAFDHRGYPDTAATISVSRGEASLETDVSPIGQTVAR